METIIGDEKRDYCRDPFPHSLLTKHQTVLGVGV